MRRTSLYRSGSPRPEPELGASRAPRTRTLPGPEGYMTDTARLSRAVLPIDYDLEIETDAESPSSRAGSRSPWRSWSRRPTIVLHAKELEVELVGLTQGDRPVAATLSIDAASERITVTADHPLADRRGGAVAAVRRAGEPRHARLLPQHLHRHVGRRARARRRRSSRRRTRGGRSRASTSRSSRPCSG